MKDKHNIKMLVKKGDTVVVISGNDKDLTKPRTVLKVLPEKQRLIVEGVFIQKHHKKVQPNQNEAIEEQTADEPKSGILAYESPIHISKVMLWDDKIKKGTRVRIERDQKGKSRRISVKSGNVI